MDRYMKAFVYAALFYLGVATIFGVLNGTMDLGYWGIFAHTHFNLLGFMAMMIYGIGYFILPRFNGTDLRFPGWMVAHFWIANISLPGMVITRGLQIETGSDMIEGMFILFASFQAISVFMFIINCWLSLSPPKKKPVPTAVPTPQPVAEKAPSKGSILITPESAIGELVDAVPAIKDFLVESGLAPLVEPGHLEKVRKMGITLGMACMNHSIDLDPVIMGIENILQENGYSTSMQPATASEAAKPVGGKVDQITSETMIGALIDGFPSTRPVFEKYFGSGCFDCPGQAFETVDMACRMHNVDPDTVLAELNDALH